VSDHRNAAGALAVEGGDVVLACTVASGHWYSHSRA